LQFSEQQMYDAILVPIRQGGPELPGQSQFPCIHSIPKKLQVRWIEVESTVGIGSNFHATLHRKEFLLK
jgi:hypothetical protein